MEAGEKVLSVGVYSVVPGVGVLWDVDGAEDDVHEGGVGRDGVAARAVPVEGLLDPLVAGLVRGEVVDAAGVELVVAAPEEECVRERYRERKRSGVHQ